RVSRAFARLGPVLSEGLRRGSGAVRETLGRMWQGLPAEKSSDRIGIISGATGAEPATGEERAWLKTVLQIPVRATGSYVGQGFEPQFAMNVALAALVLHREKLFAPWDSSGVEREYEGALDRIVVTGVGHWRGEGMAL